MLAFKNTKNGWWRQIEKVDLAGDQGHIEKMTGRTLVIFWGVRSIRMSVGCLFLVEAVDDRFCMKIIDKKGDKQEYCEKDQV